MELVIVTGMSGAGKSQAAHALEDIGFYCVDNMPPALMQKVAELCGKGGEAVQRVALVTDVRSGRMFDDLQNTLAAMRRDGVEYRILFLDCADEVICRRYKETRRRHPLAAESDRTEDVLATERQMLAPIAEMADYRLDTTHLGTAQLKKQIMDIFLTDTDDAMTIRCVSFGFKYGFPAEADIMLDVRCFPNPFYVPELKTLTGLDPAVRDFVLAAAETQEFLRRMYAMLDYLIPLYINEGKTQLTIAIGCTGGKHRSVAIAQELAEHILQTGHRTLIDHRDIDKK